MKKEDRSTTTLEKYSIRLPVWKLTNVKKEEALNSWYVKQAVIIGRKLKHQKMR